MAKGDTIVYMKNIVKVYPDGTVALRGVDFEAREGEIHGLLGENGAGKTTLMKILSGLLKPTQGEIYIRGKKVSFKSASEALKHGIGMVHQHLALVPVFTAFENIALGLPLKTVKREEIVKLMEETGLKIPLDAVVEDLPLGVRQRIEILKMLYRNVKILILDEPTTNLTPTETKELFRTLKVLKEQGRTIIFITHKLREVMEITDRITVLRRGRVVGVVETKNVTPEQLAKMMVGREVVFKIEKKPAKPREPALIVKDLWVKSDLGGWAVKGVSFEVRAGEIFGIAGVEGNGQTELIEAITGLRKVEKGEIILLGKKVTNKNPAELYKMGLGHIPEDRTKLGLILEMSIAENAILGIHKNAEFLGKYYTLNWDNIFKHAENVINRFDIIAPGVKAPAKSLSGGNQQKLVVGREISKQPTVIIAAQPTRGLDVAATEYIRKLLIKMRDEGKAVLLVSADLDEVLQLSDRMAVMYEGKFMGIARPEELTKEQIGLMMGGYTLEQVLARAKR
ncbi:ABC transporter ATP-binding protein [Desulfurococcaceae archaeon MEX13E-LK6-19]|nr:ABC transporter ATP-binding protein [Desulfurococcaceae archaeon MEX13E-LK6-19]